jgi:hypothetical protein
MRVMMGVSFDRAAAVPRGHPGDILAWRILSPDVVGTHAT